MRSGGYQYTALYDHPLPVSDTKYENDVILRRLRLVRSLLPNACLPLREARAPSDPFLFTLSLPLPFPLLSGTRLA